MRVLIKRTKTLLSRVGIRYILKKLLRRASKCGEASPNVTFSVFIMNVRILMHLGGVFAKFRSIADTLMLY